LVRRASGRPFGQFIADEITGPLGADFHVALRAPADRARLAELWFPLDVRDAPTPLGPAAMGAQTFAEFADIQQSMVLDPELLPAVWPAGSGIANARAVARIGSIISGRGEVGGRRYLSGETVDEAVREQCREFDEVLGARLRLGVFFALDDDPYHAPTPTTVHWGGFGGSWVTMDPASGITCAYTPNRLLIGDELLLRQAAQWQVLTDVLAT
jgi:CubicO group peptidase (beta-lactamase class C family)